MHPPPPKPPKPQSSTSHDPPIRVWESKYELDSLAYFLDLSAKLMTASGRHDPLFNGEWRAAVRLVLRVCRMQQRGTDEEVELLGVPWRGSPKEGEAEADEEREQAPSTGNSGRYEGRRGVYRFQRHTWTGSETRPLDGLGEPGKRCGELASRSSCPCHRPS